MGKADEIFGRAVLDSLTAHVAIIDEAGVIIETNAAWKRYAEANAINIRPDAVGINYLALCDQAQGPEAETARRAAAGIRAVATGEIPEFVMDYKYHSGKDGLWFNMRVTRLSAPGPVRLVVSHEDINGVKLAEAAVRRREAELGDRTKRLKEANIALRVLLHQHEEDKKELEENVLSQTTGLVLPYLATLESGMRTPAQKTLLKAAISNLEEVISPFARSLSSKNLGLTPKEIYVAGLIKEGRTSKEIAEVLNVSQVTVDFHRKNIRKKLGLKHKRTNLTSYLLTMDS